jgi:hypothetical protein
MSVIVPELSMTIIPPPMMKPFGCTKSPRALSLPVSVMVTFPALMNLMKPVPAIWNVFCTCRARPWRSNRQPLPVTSMPVLIVTVVPLQGPLGAAHNTLAVFAIASPPQLRDTACAVDGSDAAHTSKARAIFRTAAIGTSRMG